MSIILDALRAIIMLPASIQTFLPSVLSSSYLREAAAPPPRSKMDDFIRECKAQFEGPLKTNNLLSMSAQLQKQFKEKLQSSKACMLPSYNHTLPTGNERGKYLAMDLGGSKLRVALVELAGRANGAGGMKIIKLRTVMIDKSIRALQGQLFFDWMAGRIRDLLEEPNVKGILGEEALGMGLAWSFPVEQTSMTSGIILEMGKGFNASVGILGEDIGTLLWDACKRKNLNVRMDAIINDSAATLLSRAYQDSATCFALILGTGFNMAVMLPVPAIARPKYGKRPQSWFNEAKDVLVNTELSMFGKGIFPTTKWDDFINVTHEHPDYQPFEHLLGGRYLGEIVRLILVEAIQNAGLFSGQLPVGFEKRYTLEAGTIAILEFDDTPDFSEAAAILAELHPLPTPPSKQDLRYAQQICQLVSHRAAAYLATGIHALWVLRCSSEGISPRDSKPVTIGCNGSVIELYPQFRPLTKSYLNDLTTLSGARPNCVSLEMAYDSSIYGAAVAVGCVEGDAQ